MRRLLVLSFALIAAACGSSGSSINNPGAATPTASVAGTFSLTEKTALNGTALSDQEGFTLYMFKPDAAGMPTCTGACAQTWLPEAAPDSLPSVPAGLSGAFGSVARPDGSKQLTYAGWPLYRYSADASATDANGQGIGGNWFAVTASTKAAAGAAAAATSAAPATSSSSSSSSSSYNYYN